MAKHEDQLARASSLATGWTIEAHGGESEAPVDDVNRTSRVAGDPSASDNVEAGGAATQLPSLVLVMLGLIAGVYLCYTVVWFSWAQYYSAMNTAVAQGSGSLGGVMQQIVFWFAPLAPVLWFLSVLALGKQSSLRVRALWLVVGAVVLVPLPMFGGVL